MLNAAFVLSLHIYTPSTTYLDASVYLRRHSFNVGVEQISSKASKLVFDLAQSMQRIMCYFKDDS